MSHVAPTIAVVLLTAALPPGCATFNLLDYDRLTDVRSICDVPFEEGTVVRVAADFDGDRYHGDGLFDSECKGVYWSADWTDDFARRHAKRLELGNALFIGPHSRYRVEVEGRIFLSGDGKPAIRFQHLGKSQAIARLQ
jgi:hypothetical protein